MTTHAGVGTGGTQRIWIERPPGMRCAGRPPSWQPRRAGLSRENTLFDWSFPVVMKAAALLLVLVFLSMAAADEPALKYPPTKKGDVVDDYHGVKVPAPYRWLEDDVRVSKDVAVWVDEQARFTDAYLSKIPER